VLEIRRVLKPGGVYVTLGGDARSIVSAVALGAVVSAATKRSAGLMLWWRPFAADDLATVLRLIGQGDVRPFVDRRYPLEGIVDALQWVEDGHARGKVVVQIG
jgi:NADPH:quinone reductase-like Zn-dependent oxidoreductase